MQNFAPLAPVADVCVKRNQETKSEDRDGKKFHSRVKCLRKKRNLIISKHKDHINQITIFTSLSSVISVKLHLAKGDRYTFEFVFKSSHSCL